MCKGCNSIIRIFSLPISEHAMDYIDQYKDDEDFSNIDGKVDDEYILSCGDIALVKIGYDKDKRPLYKLLVGDGSRPLKELGYIVSNDTKPEFGLCDVEDPMCLGEMSAKGIAFPEGVDAISNDEVCEAFCPNLDDELDVEYGTDYDDADIIEQNEEGTYVVKQKTSDDGVVIMQSTDIKF